MRIKKGRASCPPLGPWIEKSGSRFYYPGMLPALPKAPIIRTDFDNLTLASALMRLYFNVFQSIVLKAQTHDNTECPFLHSDLDLESCERFPGIMRSTPTALMSLRKKASQLGLKCLSSS